MISSFSFISNLARHCKKTRFLTISRTGFTSSFHVLVSYVNEKVSRNVLREHSRLAIMSFNCSFRSL